VPMLSYIKTPKSTLERRIDRQNIRGLWASNFEKPLVWRKNKKPKRIAALMMIMTLCLMVYAFVQDYIREELKAKKETIPNQRKKEIDNPTATLVFRSLHRIQIVCIQLEDGTRECVANLNELRTRIIKLFGPLAIRIYGIT
jgi:hypothetical protein